MLVRPIAVHVFHVRKVVRGVFAHADFVMTEQPGGCGLDESSIRLGHLTPPVGDKPFYLVIRPTATPAEVATDIPYPSFGPEKGKPLPVMTWRSESEPALCSSSGKNTGCVSPAVALRAEPTACERGIEGLICLH
jgi:hypothetical protein